MNDQGDSKGFEAGYSFYSEGNIDKAIECWKDIRPDDDPKAYVYAQHYLAQFYAVRNDMKQARVHWSNISRDSRDDIYANAQFNLGSSWYQEKDFDQAIFYWKNVPKIESNMHFYIEAQFNLAVFYFQKGDVKQAQLHCLSIPKIDDDRYNFAQINLGNSYAQQGNMEKALFHWRNVFRRDGEEYCLAQFSLANFYAQHRDIGQARIHWNNISKGNLKLYAIAQFNLGTSFLEEGNIQEAQLHLSCVPKIDDECNIYAKAQFNLANIFNAEGNLKQAQIHWGNIPEKIEEQNIYLQAQINLANSFNKEGNVKQARIHWNNIPNEKNKNNTYAKAQVNLGRSFNREGNFKQARIHLNNVLKNNLDSTYAQAQFYLGSILQEERNFHQVEEYWKEIIHYPIKFDDGNYRSDLITYNMKKIATFFQINRSKVQYLIPSMILLYIEDIQEHVENILMNLRINSNNLMSENIPDQQLYFEKVEKQFAHYTRVEIAELIIKNGSFHLGFANHMNDPQEGKVLLNEWKIPLNYNNNLLAFLTSFTFNENSLNQFRLYGKKDNVDGSGVSLVIKNNFFELMFDPGKHVNMALLSVNEDNQKNISKNIKNKKRLSNKLPLYRCIYMYPGMKYINIAHRNELSFFLDKDDNVNINKKWKVYIEKMNEIRSNVTNELDNITKTIKEVIMLIEKDGIVEQNKIYEVIATTLLPIIYLTKHAAFEEEAECRIVYITSQDDEVIQKDRDRVYVEYAINLADQYQQEERSQNYLERIYLGPKADPRAELNLKKCWIDKMREKGMANNEIKIPTIIKSDMPLA